MNRQTLAVRFAALGDEHRLTMVEALRNSDLTPSQLGDIAGLPSNLAAHHLGILEAAGLVARSRSEGDGRRRYVMLVDDEITHLLGPVGPLDGSVAFVCTHNSARSQFAAARFTQLTGRPASSAGTHPASSVHPDAVLAAQRFGIDLSDRQPTGYQLLDRADLVVSVCDRALEHGLPPHTRHLHWSIPDPSPVGGAAAFRSAFDLIDRRLVRLVSDA